MKSAEPTELTTPRRRLEAPRRETPGAEESRRLARALDELHGRVRRRPRRDTLSGLLSFVASESST